MEHLRLQATCSILLYDRMIDFRFNKNDCFFFLFQWRPPEFYLYPLGIFSYIGAVTHISFALATLFMLNYLR